MGERMNLVEFAEKTSPVPLTDWQKQFLSAYEQAREERKVIRCVLPRINGRRILMPIIDEFKKDQAQ